MIMEELLEFGNILSSSNISTSVSPYLCETKLI